MHADETGRLWRRSLRPGAEPVVMVEVVTSTPEPDRARKTYLLCVTPTTRTARGGVAWTLGLYERHYAPVVET